MTRNARMPTNAFLKRLSETLSASIDKYPLLDMDSMFSEVSMQSHICIVLVKVDTHLVCMFCVLH